MSRELLNAIHEIRQSQVWSIVLVPKRLYREAMIAAAALCDAEVSGRTVRWVDRPGKMTLVYAEMENPVPKGVPFDLYLTGWHSSDEKDRKFVQTWMESARKLSSSNSYSWDQTPLSSDSPLDA